MMIDETMIQKLAEDLRFRLDEEDVLLIKEEFSAYEEMLQVFERIDTEDIEEMVSPVQTPVSVLREDREGKCLSQEEILTNAAKKEDGMIVLPQVVKK